MINLKLVHHNKHLIYFVNILFSVFYFEFYVQKIKGAYTLYIFMRQPFTTILLESTLL